MKVYKKDLVFGSVVFIVLSIYAFLADFKFDYIGLSFLINTMVGSVLFSLSMRNQINTLLFYYLFSLIFMIFVPWLQYSLGILIWTSIPFHGEFYLYVNALIFFSNIFCFFAYKIFPVYYFKDKKVNKGNFILGSVLCFLSFLIVFYSVGFDFRKIFFRGVEGDSIENSFSSYFLIFVYLARFFPAFLFMKYYSNGRKKESYLFLIFTLLCSFPLGITRFMVAFIYLPILMMFFPFLKKSIYVSVIIFASILFVFPFLNQFRYYSDSMRVEVFSGFDFFTQGHFDAYQNFMDVIRTDFVTMGQQILGVLLFFIPRTYWEGKPVGSGYTLAENNHYYFNNISMPYIAEGYVNFGIFGIFSFVLFLAYALKQIDYNLLFKFHYLESNYQVCKGVFFCTSIFFMMRGDLMSSFSFMLAAIFAFKVAENV
ncbi:O-antigen polymerase [Acinetobacter baumannii]|uniref:O-antigen polymerase n=3 Tax=Acinetobacter baumannii TaxID=470 RepID=UPI0024B72B03|nr:O-antigen polymerase [Acinetobacter baumannii]MDI9710059.1 O-antigen polymerase [Acinetobacter baumannii]